nr:hypothetical protein [Klebsiella pneumoniae]URZ93026.1 hypothetical protein [Klebsiella pneumoniae]
MAWLDSCCAHPMKSEKINRRTYHHAFLQGCELTVSCDVCYLVSHRVSPDQRGLMLHAKCRLS